MVVLGFYPISLFLKVMRSGTLSPALRPHARSEGTLDTSKSADFSLSGKQDASARCNAFFHPVPKKFPLIYGARDLPCVLRTS